MSQCHPPRILFVDHTGKLGGAELSLLAVARAFRETSHVVLFEEGPFFDRLLDAGIETTVLPASSGLDRIRRAGSVLTGVRAFPGLLVMVWRLARLARHYDLILANSQKSMVIAAFAGLLARRPVVWYLRDLLSQDHFGRVQRRLAAGISSRFVTRVIANSHASREALIACGGRSDRMVVIHNGIDDTPFLSVSSETTDAVRHELQLPSTGVVGVFSRLSAWKGQHVLLEALRDLPDVTVLLVGEALFPKDEEYVVQLRAQLDTWGLEDRVRMLGFREDIPALMSVCNAVIHTSTSPEPFGRVIIEGMLANRPVIATAEGGPSEIITDGQTGILIPSNDATALRHAIRHVLDDVTTATTLSNQGHALARTSFSTERMIAYVRATVNDVLQKPILPTKS